MRDVEISVGGVEKGQRICCKLLDQPLYDSRHFASVARQVVVIRTDFRYVRILVTCLFQSLRAAEPRSQPDGLQEVIITGKFPYD